MLGRKGDGNWGNAEFGILNWGKLGGFLAPEASPVSPFLSSKLSKDREKPPFKLKVTEYD